jgi:hypothetical protein
MAWSSGNTESLVSEPLTELDQRKALECRGVFTFHRTKQTDSKTLDFETAGTIERFISVDVAHNFGVTELPNRNNDFFGVQT